MFTKLGDALVDLETAWQARLADAEALFAAGRNGGAIATGLYALEIRLKVAICKRLDLERLPKNFEIHDLQALLLLAGWSRRIDRKSARKVKAIWDAIVRQSEELNKLRYTGDKNWTHAQAATFLNQLKDPPNGVLPWLSAQR